MPSKRRDQKEDARPRSEIVLSSVPRRVATGRSRPPDRANRAERSVERAQLRALEAGLLHIGGRDPFVVESALVHGVSLAHENVGRNLVFGASKFSQCCEKRQIIERFDWQRQAECSGFRAIFWSRHWIVPHCYNQIIMAL